MAYMPRQWIEASSDDIVFNVVVLLAVTGVLFLTWRIRTWWDTRKMSPAEKAAAYVDEFDGIKQFAVMLLMIPVGLGMIGACVLALYGLVRFVRWAWYN